jgi:hypothetical protein
MSISRAKGLIHGDARCIRREFSHLLKPTKERIFMANIEGSNHLRSVVKLGVEPTPNLSVNTVS